VLFFVSGIATITVAFPFSFASGTPQFKSAMPPYTLEFLLMLVLVPTTSFLSHPITTSCSTGVHTRLSGWFDDSIDFILGTTPNLGDFNDANSDIVVPSSISSNNEDSLAQSFDGRVLRELIVKKWGEDFDVEFKRTDYLGRSTLYLNITPWSLGKKPFRHASEADYLSHLEAVAQLLIKYKSVGKVVNFIDETKKAPRRNTIPILMVSIRLNVDDGTVKDM